ncbi:MAG: DNA (cytosine-5-)-methyltransferase [Actinomycetota bacterium]|nr:DNA (cytosine-5-)-methyltransferase [Actinomycetota bacterium]
MMTARKHAPQMNIKGIPEDLQRWVSDEAHRTGRKQNEVVLEALRNLKKTRAADVGANQQLDLELLEPKPAPAAALRFHFRFIDLFAGVGGFRLALDTLGGECVFSSEWDKHSQRTYTHWFGGEIPHGDINEVAIEAIPDHDVLTAGFPCQPFSLAGVSKKNSLGQKHGFQCERQGNLFFRICDIVTEKRPPILILENVKNLKSHDKGRTWEIIRSELDKLDYEVNAEIIDAAGWVPQHRERIFIVCFDRRIFGRGEKPFRFPTPPKQRPTINDILESDEEVDKKYILSEKLWTYLQNYADKHRRKGNGFGFGMVTPDDDPENVTRTLSARYHKDGSEILIDRGPRRRPRRLTPLECARLMGFDARVKCVGDIAVSDTQAYRQFGNAVVPKVVAAVAANALARMDDLRRVSSKSHCAVKGRLRPRARAT